MGSSTNGPIFRSLVQEKQMKSTSHIKPRVKQKRIPECLMMQLSAKWTTNEFDSHRVPRTLEKK